jgi:uncharacterized membrane protein YjfL (UPF0719 family)
MTVKPASNSLYWLSNSAVCLQLLTYVSATLAATHVSERLTSDTSSAALYAVIYSNLVP